MKSNFMLGERVSVQCGLVGFDVNLLYFKYIVNNEDQLFYNIFFYYYYYVSFMRDLVMI